MDPEGRLRGGCSKCSCPSYSKRSNSHVCGNCTHVAREHHHLESCHVAGCNCHQCELVKGVPRECANCGHGVNQHTPNQDMKVRRTTSRKDDAVPSTSGLGKRPVSYAAWEDFDDEAFEEVYKSSKREQSAKRRRFFVPKGGKGKGKGKGRNQRNLQVSLMTERLCTVPGSTLGVALSEDACADTVLREYLCKAKSIKKVDKSCTDGEYLLVNDEGVSLKYLPGTKRPFTLMDFKEWNGLAWSRQHVYVMTKTDYLGYQASLEKVDRDEYWEEAKLDAETLPNLPNLEAEADENLPADIDELPNLDTSAAMDLVADDPEVVFNAPGHSTSTPNMNNTTVVLEHPDTSRDREFAEMLQQIYDNEDNEDYASSDDADTSRDLPGEQIARTLSMDSSEKEERLKAIVDGLNVKNVKKDVHKVYVVRRDNVWRSLKEKLCRKGFDASKVVKVKFIGEEETVDFGGPKTEMFRLALQGMFENSGLFEASPHGYLPVSSPIALVNGDFVVAGKAMAMSVVHQGPTPSCLHPAVVSALAGQTLPDMTGYKPVNRDVAAFVEKLEQASESSLREILQSDDGLDMVSMAGWRKASRQTSLDDVPMLKTALCLQDLVISRKSAIEQLKEGLKLLGLGDALEAKPQLIAALLCKSTEVVSADSIAEWLVVKWAPEGSNHKEKQKDVFENLTSWLDVVEEGSARVSLEDFLQFFTALEARPPTGWPMEPMLHFVQCDDGCRCLPVANTCSFSLYLPEHMATLSKAEFYSTMEEAIISGRCFGRT